MLGHEIYWRCPAECTPAMLPSHTLCSQAAKPGVDREREVGGVGRSVGQAFALGRGARVARSAGPRSVDGKTASFIRPSSLSIPSHPLPYYYE